MDLRDGNRLTEILDRQVAKYVMRIREILQENAFARYEPMFSLFTEEAMAQSRPYIKQAFDTFKGNSERLVWAMKWLRIALVDRFQVGDDWDTAMARYRRDFPGMADDILVKNASFLRHTMGIFKHYLSLPIPEIQNFRYGRQYPEDVNDQFFVFQEKFEQEHEEEVPSLAQDETLISFPDGFEWVNLNRPGCDSEARAMGHCGNGEGQEGQTIFSLRKKTRDGLMRPSLTFIFDTHAKSLGEMKGRANQKPNAKYHKYIMELLKLPQIERVEGGGYLPKNNFHITDLTPEQQDEVFAANPDLKSSLYLGCTAEIDGKPFWIATFDIDPIRISGTYDAWAAEEAGHHSSFYMSPEDDLLVEKGRYFWINHENKIAFESEENWDFAEKTGALDYIKSKVKLIKFDWN